MVRRRGVQALGLALGILCADATLACPWHKSMIALGFWAPSVMATQAELEALFGPMDGFTPPLEVAGGPSDVGQWQPPRDWPVIAIHAGLLPSGEVLHYSYPNGGPGSAAVLWNPATDLFTDVTFDTDIFCSGLSLLPDGELYVTGGNNYDCEFQGRTVTQKFDPFTRDWTALDDMVTGRWYPSNTALGDGRTMILSGLDLICEVAPEMEVYTPDTGLERIVEGDRSVALYPRFHLLTSGLVAHVGPEQQTFTFDPVQLQWLYVDDMAQPGRWDGTSFLVPGHQDEIVTCGGSGALPPTANCERIDFSQGSPQWTSTGSMNFARSHADALILPNRQVLIMGGGTDELYGDPVFNPEIYDPDTEEWTILPAHVHGRMYHATTVLLPDGRVLVAGQDNGASAFRAEIYEPAYLFNGPPPVVTQAPPTIVYGREFTISTPQAADITDVALLAPTTVTHSVNGGQRYVGLTFQADAGSLTVTAPANGFHAPPGYYMLFLVDSAGVPSVAEMVKVVGTGIFENGFESGDTTAWSSTIP